MHGEVCGIPRSPYFTDRPGSFPQDTATQLAGEVLVLWQRRLGLMMVLGLA